jgi:hypothetical protein
MTENNHVTNGHDVFIKPMVDFWTHYIEQSKQHTQALLDSMRGVADLTDLRKRWLESVSQTLDGYMRTPTFLETMRRNFETMTEFKANSEEASQGIARELGVPRINDISGLFERVRTGQEAILTRLDAIERRLDTLQKPAKKNTA